MRSLRLLAGIVHLVILFENTGAEKILYELEVNPQNCKPAIPRSTSPVSVNFKGKDTTTSGSHKTTGYMPLTKIHAGPFETKTYVFYAEDVGEIIQLMQVKLTDDGQLGNWCLATSKLTIAKHNIIIYLDGGTVQPKIVTDLEVAFAETYTGSPPPFPTSPPFSPTPSVVPTLLTPDPPAHTWASTSAREGSTTEPLSPVVYILIVGAVLMVVFGMITVGCMVADRRSRRKGKDHGKGEESEEDTASSKNTASASSLLGKPVGQPVQPVKALGAVKYKSISSKTAKLTLGQSMKKRATRPHVRLDLKKVNSKKKLPQKKLPKIKKKVHHPYQGRTKVFVRKEHKTGQKMKEIFITDESMKSMRER